MKGELKEMLLSVQSGNCRINKALRKLIKSVNPTERLFSNEWIPLKIDSTLKFMSADWVGKILKERGRERMDRWHDKIKYSCTLMGQSS